MSIINIDVYIYTIAVGFGSKTDNICIEKQKHMANFVLQLKHCVGSKAVFVEQKNECIILLTRDSDSTHNELIKELYGWTRRYGERYEDLYFSIAYDEREANRINSISESTSMAKFSMYRNYLNTIPGVELDKDRLYGFIKIFQKILDDLIEACYKKSASGEMIKLSEFIDELVGRYSKMSSSNS